MDQATYRALVTVTYDPVADASYIQFGELVEEMKPLKTRRVLVQNGRFEVMIDLASDGSLFGIEILGADEALSRHSTVRR